MAISALLLALIDVMCESVLVGTYAALAALVMYRMITKRRKMPTVHMALFGASIVMFCLSVVHLALVIQQHVATANVLLRNIKTQLVLVTFQFAISDLILIWRVWIVWGRNYFVAFPPFAIMVTTAGIQFRAASLREITSIFNVAPAALLMSNACICTFLIAGKIWYSNYQLKQLSCGIMKSSGFNSTIALFIESGALYTVIIIISFVLNHVRSDGIHIVLDLAVPLVGIAPTLIITIVHFGLASSTGGETNSLLTTRTHMEFANRKQVDIEISASSMTTSTRIT